MSSSVREVVVRIVSESQGGSGRPEEEKPEGNEEQNKPKSIFSATTLLVNEAFQMAKRAVVQIASYEIGKSFTLNDDYIGQNAMNNALGLINKGVSLATATAAGAMMGSAGGPWGAIIGGTLAFAGTLGSNVITAFQAADRQALSVMTASAYQAFRYSRKGDVLSNGSIGDNL